MKFEPANVFMICWSLKSLRNCTCGARADPYVAVAMRHGETWMETVSWCVREGELLVPVIVS